MSSVIEHSDFNMKGLKVLQCLILNFSTCMFFYQLEVSLRNLYDPPIIRSTEKLKLNQIEPPMITICPLNQINETKLKEIGYPSYFDLLVGKDISLATDNFWEVIDKVITYSPSKDVDFKITYDEGKIISNMSDLVQRFYPKFGFCWEVSDYKIKDEMKIVGDKILKKIEKVKIFLTDKLLCTMPALDLSNHRGNTIEMNSGKESTYFTEITKVSFFDPSHPERCKEYEATELEACVDNGLQNLTKKLFICQPPWLTNRNVCKDMQWREKVDFLKDPMAAIRNGIQFIVDENAVDRVVEMENFRARRNCTKPCTVTRSIVRAGSTKKLRGKASPGARLLIDETILYSKDIIGYDFTNFLVDMGSSIGLWFGLSIMSLSELSVQTFQFMKVSYKKVSV